MEGWRTEMRGQRDVNALDRRIPDSSVRVAIAVVMVSVTAVTAATMLLEKLGGGLALIHAD